MEAQMITLYTWGTPNGRKASIALEEMGLAYRVHPVNIGKSEQFDPDFLKISPNNKIPAIVDHDADDLSIFETGAILVYLAEKTGQFLAPSGPARYRALEWLNWQMGGLGPMVGQLGWFTVFAPEPVPLAIERYTNEVKRLLGVLARRLAEGPYVAGADYSIADMAVYPWLLNLMTFYKQPHLVEAHRELIDYLARVGARPGVQRGMLVPAPTV
jgi:GSH-dependent disulfide-bond oxidoreductase